MPAPHFSPICTVLAGPNGSGKSTVFQSLAPPGELVNADEFARRINPEHPEDASSYAGREVLSRLEELISQRQNFTYETTLSSNQSLSLMNKAKDGGYRVELAFVLLKSPDLNVARVKTRVAQGGHDIPTKIIMRRYDKVFTKLSAAIRLAHQVIIYDNTARELATLIRLNGGRIEFNALEEAELLHCRLAEAIAQALDLSTDTVFQAAKHRS